MYNENNISEYCANILAIKISTILIGVWLQLEYIEEKIIIDVI